MEEREYETLYHEEERFWWYRGLHELVLQQVDVQARSHRLRLDRILDAGCGTGGMAKQLAARGPTVGLDWSPHALRWARRRVDRLARGSVAQLPFTAQSFDLAVSLDVLYHAGVPDDDDALRELHRCLRPGGLLVLNLPAFESLRSSHDEAIHTARRYRRAPLRRKLEAAGFRIERLTYWNSVLFPALALVRWTRRQTRSRRAGAEEGVGRSDVEPVPGVLDRMLSATLSVERAWLRLADLPYGLSLLAVARRPGGSAEEPNR